MTAGATAASDLLEASDEQIARAVAHAEPMVLRGLLYQLTGDEEAAATRITVHPTGFQTFMTVAAEADVAMAAPSDPRGGARGRGVRVLPTRARSATGRRPALIVFDTEVRALTWDEAASEWEVEVDGSEGRHIEIR